MHIGVATDRIEFVKYLNLGPAAFHSVNIAERRDPAIAGFGGCTGSLAKDTDMNDQSDSVSAYVTNGGATEPHIEKSSIWSDQHRFVRE